MEFLSDYLLDFILVPFSLCLTIGYHVFLLRRFNSKKYFRTRMCIPDIIQGHENKGIVGVQSLRNTLMTTILGSSLAILVNSALAALANNTYKTRRPFHDPFFGSQADPVLILKYASASVFSLFSFVCSSLAVGCFYEVNFLVSLSDEISLEYVQALIDHGCILATAGSRALYITFPLLLWMMGPVAVAVSSVALIWVLYQLDHPYNGFKEDSSEEGVMECENGSDDKWV